MTIDELIIILKAYKERKRIQCRDKRGGEWEDLLFIGEEALTGSTCIGQEWNTAIFDYRIKPLPHYRPFKDTDEVVEAIKEHGNLLKTKSNIFYTLNSFHFLGCTGYFFTSTHSNVSQEQMLTDFVFADGTPFGKLEE